MSRLRASIRWRATGFWEHLIDLSRHDKVTIFVSTHFINEAARCDRMSLMSAGKVLVIDTPAAVVKKRGAATLEDAFIGYLEDAEKEKRAASRARRRPPSKPRRSTRRPSEIRLRLSPMRSRFSFQRMFANSYRELKELSRDPIRLTLAGMGSVILMIIIGYGITLDVEHLNYAAMDRDQTAISREYLINIAGSSRYFTERPPLADYQEFDRRMRSGELSMVVEIPPDFGRDVERGFQITPASRRLDRWRHAAARRNHPRLYAGHAPRLADSRSRGIASVSTSSTPAQVELRYRYNPDVKSLVAMVPAVIPLLLLLIPAMLATLSVVREKDLGSIINFYVTPTTRLEFLLGKQLPYVALGMINFLLLALLAVTLFRVPMKGDFS